MIEVRVLGAYSLAGEEALTVVLQSGGRVLPISVGPFEGAAIDYSLKGKRPPRPMTHDLILNILAGLRGVLKSVTVYKFEESTFFAYLTVEQRDAAGRVEQVLRVDTRPSDGIAVAVRAKCPVYVAEEVFEAAGQDVGFLEAVGLPGADDADGEPPAYKDEEPPEEESSGGGPGEGGDPGGDPGDEPYDEDDEEGF